MNQGHTFAFSRIFMKPYQQKMASKIAESGDQVVAKPIEEISIEEALKQLTNQHDKQEQENFLKKRFDQTLAKLVDSEVKLGLVEITRNSQNNKQKEKKTLEEVKNTTQEEPLPEKIGPLNLENSKEVAKPDESVDPPLDWFGISPGFYIKRKKKTATWVGCFCSVLEVAIAILVVIFLTINYFKREKPQVSIFNSKQRDKPLTSLKDNRQFITLTPLSFGLDHRLLFPNSAYYVVKSTVTNKVV